MAKKTTEEKAPEENASSMSEADAKALAELEAEAAEHATNVAAQRAAATMAAQIAEAEETEAAKRKAAADEEAEAARRADAEAAEVAARVSAALDAEAAEERARYEERERAEELQRSRIPLALVSLDSGRPPRSLFVPPPPNMRDVIFESVFLSAKSGATIDDKSARAIADEACDRLRVNHDEDHRGEVSAGFYDLREEQDYSYPNGAIKVQTVDRAKRVPFMRDPSTVDSIVIHQTACEFGVSRRAVEAAGDIELARARRALDVACHALAFRNGYFAAAHDLPVLVHHAGRLNDRSLGLEIEGRYPGLLDDPDTLPREDLRTTWGGPPSVFTDEACEAACGALRWLVEEGRRLGMPIKYIYAHRQSSEDRRSDPGQEIWERVVLSYGVPELGLQTRTHEAWKGGRPVPTQWDLDGEGNY